MKNNQPFSTMSDESLSSTKLAILDEKDQQLIHLLQGNARLSYAELGSVISLSSDAVRMRLDRLIKDHCIRLVTLVDPALFGQSVRFSFGVVVQGDPDIFSTWAQAQKEIIHLTRTVGSFSFFGELVGETDIKMHNFIHKHLRSAPGVLNTEYWPMLRIVKWREDTGSPPATSEVLAQVAFSDDDRAMLRELVNEPRIQFRELAERLQRPYGIVRRRASALLESGVVRSTVIINDILVEHSYLAILLVNGDSRAQEFLLENEQVTIFSASCGSRQFVGEVRTKSKEELAMLCQQLRMPESGITDCELMLQVSVDKLPASFQF